LDPILALAGLAFVSGVPLLSIRARITGLPVEGARKGYPLLTKPWLLLHGEGGAILVLSLLAYHRLHGGWGWFALLFLTPDVFMVGYLASQRTGAALYNVAHTLLAPSVLIAVGLLTTHSKPIAFALIWSAHIGFDRLLGYGLKYPTRFQDTHLQRVR
jgi:hypothetical protein